MRSTIWHAAPFLAQFSLVFAQYNTPAGESTCGMNIKDKVPPANGDCSIAGGIFSIGVPMELMSYLFKKGLSIGSGKEESKSTDKVARNTTGPYTVAVKIDPNLPGHSIYAPATPPNIEMPFLTWGNGGCGTSPVASAGAFKSFGTGYDGFLREIASYGYVIAADGPMSGSQTHVKDMLVSISWAKSGGAKTYGKVDTTKIATMGHSCGGLEGMSVSYHNPDVSLTLMFNIATFFDDKRYLLKELKAPVAWFVGNPTDIGYENSRKDYGNLTETLPAFWASLDTGHMGTFTAPNGGKTAKAAKEFLQWQFRGDAKAKEYCLNGIETDNWNVQHKNWK